MKNIFRSGVILVLIISVIAVGKNIYNQLSKFKEIHQAESKVQKLTKEQALLQARLKEGNEQSFLEEQARDKLGYQQPGETLYVIDLKNGQSENGKEKVKENLQEWIDLLLH